MNNYMKTIISGIKTWAEEFFVGSDWNESNPESVAYIKNRPFYDGGMVETDMVLLPETTIDGFESNEELYVVEYIIPFIPEIGETYTVYWDGVAYECLCSDINEYDDRLLGNPVIYYENQTGVEDATKPFAIFVWKNGGTGGVITASDEESHVISIVKKQVVHNIRKIESKYLTQSDWNENNLESAAYIKNRPFGEGEVRDVIGVSGEMVFENCPYDTGYTTEQSFECNYRNRYDKCDPSIVILLDGEELRFDFEYSLSLPTGGQDFIGNKALMYGGTDTGEDYCAAYYGTGDYFSVDVFVREAGVHNVGVYVVYDGIIKIDEKYLPDFIGAAGIGDNGEIFNDYSNNVASGNYSHAEGRRTEANSSYAHAEGYRSIANDYASHAEGNETFADGSSSHAEGAGSITKGYASHAEGCKTIATGEAQHVQGKYNIEDSSDTTDPYKTYAHIVGNGTSDSNRSNAHTLDWQGNGWYAGSLFVGGTSQDDAEEVATKSDIFNPRSSFALTDVVNGYTYIIEMRNGNIVSRCGVKNIEISTMPNKTEYVAGEYFDPTGMTVTATCYDGSYFEITDYMYNTNYLTSNINEISISYVESGIAHTATVSITVGEYDAEAALIDFTYTTNNDGTYTITGWKGTLNGEPSTEMIVPDNGLIKL